MDAMRCAGRLSKPSKSKPNSTLQTSWSIPAQNPIAAQFGLHPQLAQLEMLVNPTVETLHGRRRMANAGTLEIIPLEQPLTLFVWSKMRVVPVRLTDFSVTEEAFDPNLNPIRAKVSLGMRVLSVDDLGFSASGRAPVHDLSRRTRSRWHSKRNIGALSRSGAIGGLP